MKSPRTTVHPETTTDSYVAILEDDLPLINYDRSGPKSVEELLYEVDNKKKRRREKIFSHSMIYI
jgi:hypothetical protein